MYTHFEKMERDSYLKPCIQIGDKKVLQLSLFKIVTKAYCITPVLQADPQNHEYQTWFETLIEQWS